MPRIEPIEAGYPDDGLTPIDRILPRLQKVRKCGEGWSARCPAHEDRKPSLTIREAEDGKVLLNCHTGCSFAQIMAAMDLPMAAAFPSPSPKTNGHSTQDIPSTPQIVARYNYYDEQGTLLFQTLRFEPKGFAQCHRDDRGHWINNIQGVRRVLYRLPELVRSAPDELVYIAEGEKDVETIRALGLVATCNPLGAEKWESDYAEFLRGRVCVLLEDNDVAGRRHVQKVGQALQGCAALVKVVSFREMPEHSDVSDWLAADHTREDLETRAMAAPDWDSEPEPETVPDEVLTRFTWHSILEAYEPRPPIEWIIERILTPGDVTGLVGTGGSLKTYLMLDALIAVGMGAEWIGLPCRKGRCLLIDEETGHDWLKVRFAQLLKGRGITCENAPEVEWITLESFDVLSRIDRAAIEYKLDKFAPDFIGIDGLAQIMRGDENEVQTIQPIFRYLRPLAARYRHGQMLIHHANRVGTYRGSSAIRDRLDALVFVTKDAEVSTVELKSDKARHTSEFCLAAQFFIDEVQNTAYFSPTTATGIKVLHVTASEQAIIDYVVENGDQTFEQLETAADAIGVREGSVRNFVHSLVRKKKLRRTNDGRQGAPAVFGLPVEG